MRILALDVGEKSCGIAWSDKKQILAHGKATFYFQPHDWNSLIEHLKQTYLYDVKLIIIGLPLLPSGSKSQTTHMVEKFRSILAQKINIPIRYVEESYTTKKAHKVLIGAGFSRQKRKKHLDKMAAIFILQKYLDFN